MTIDLHGSDAWIKIATYLGVIGLFCAGAGSACTVDWLFVLGIALGGPLLIGAAISLCLIPFALWTTAKERRSEVEANSPKQASEMPSKSRDP